MTKDKFTPLSFSSLKAFNKSPKEFIAYKEKIFEQTPAMAMGSLVHLLILEAHLFPKKYAIYKGERRSGKEWNDFKEKYSNKRTIIKVAEYEEAHRIATAVKKHHVAQLLIKSCTKYEKEIKFTEDGIELRGFVDGYCKTHLLDIKTCMDSNPLRFNRIAYDSYYHLQAAIYLKALKDKINKNAEFFIIAVEKKEPYHVAVMKCTEDFIENGNLLLKRLISEFKEWNGTNLGYEWRANQEIFDLDVPKWIKKQDAINVHFD
jgi:hypothetical protein